VALCTCARPQGLRRALAHIGELEFAGDIAVIVVDNHPDRAGLRVAEELAPSYRHRLVAEFAPARGIASARNQALRTALREPSDYVAMLDDDEWPEPNWLSELVSCQRQTGADVVCGPVVPEFTGRAPFWACASGAFGTRAAVAKTSNVLFATAALRAHGDPWFDESLGLSGGEDEEFIGRLGRRGAKFVSCDRAIVREEVGPERLRLAYLFARSVRLANVGTLLHRRALGPSAGAGLTLAAAKLAYGLNHLFWAPFSASRLACAIVDFGAATGVILALCGLRYEFYAATGPRFRRPAWGKAKIGEVG